MHYKLALLLGLFCSSIWLSAQSTVLIANTKTAITEGELLIDTTGQLSAQEVFKSTAFHNYTLPDFSLDTAEVYWHRLSLLNTIEDYEQFVVQYFGNWKIINIYQQEGTTLKEINKSGYSHIKKQHEYLHSQYHSTFTLRLEFNKPANFLVRLEMDKNYVGHPRSIEPIIWEKNKHIKNESNMRGFAYFLLGIFAIMFFYNLVLYFGTKDKNYLYYLLVLVMVALTQEINFGYLYFSSIERTTFILLLLAPFASGFQVLFMQQFLNVKKYLPFWNRIINIFYFIICIPLIPLAFGQMTLSFSLKGLVLLFMVILFMIVAIKSYQKGVPSSGYYLIAQIIIVISILLVPLFVLKIIGFSQIAIFAGPVANTLQIIFLSFGLADRINVLKKENEEKQLTIIEKERVNVKLEREKTEKLLEMNTAARKFVPQQFVHALGKESITEISLGDHVEKEVTVMFADIRDYTTLSEKMKPAEVFGFVTAYSKRIGPIIEKNNGFINQYYGDGIMAIFSNKPDDAINASIEMQASIATYNKHRIIKNRQPIKIGIGLHTGSLIMGIIGFENRNEATTISDAVNTASRVEGLTKYFKTSVLGSDTTFNKLQKADNFNWRYLGSVQVKGREQPIELYDFYDADEPTIFKLKQQTKTLYNQAIHCYFDKKFTEATSLFQSILVIFPDDPMAQYYLGKCTQLLKEDIPTDWTGVEVMLGK